MTAKKLWEENGYGSIHFDQAGRISLRDDIGNISSPFCPTIDHVFPRSRGGRSNRENLAICNRQTNQAKGSKTTWRDGYCYYAIRRCSSEEYKMDYEYYHSSNGHSQWKKCKV